LDRDALLAVVRPPPETSEYHRQNPLYDGVIDRLVGGDATTVVIPRTTEQAARLRARGATPTAEGGSRLVVPERAIDAQSLIAFADLVVSAGGTMNREAVALGTPVYTIFSGALGAVDDRLIAEGKLRPLNNPAEIELEKRQSKSGPTHPRDPGILADAVLSAAG
jgi:predicted glycosyltransferase